MWADSQKSCLKAYSGFEYKLWTDERARDFLSSEYPWFLDTWDNYPFPIQRADAIRYFVLHHYGGIYLDMDTVCHQAFPIHQVESELEHNSLFEATLPTGITNDIMISSVRHPAFASAISRLPIHHRLTRFWAWLLPYAAIMLSTGPLFISLATAAYLYGEPSLPSPTVQVISSANLKPYITDLQTATWHRTDALVLKWLADKPLVWFVLGTVGVVGGVAPRVLAIHWEADGALGVSNQAVRVRDLFQCSYRYDVELLVLKISDPDPAATLSFNLRRMLDDLGEDNLAVVYYIGQSKQSTDAIPDLLLTANALPGGPSRFIDFQEVRTRIIDPSPADVLILLDCCSAAGGTIGHRKELIAASAFDGITQTGPESFTSTLVQQLQHAIDNRHILSTAQLYSRMATLHMVMPNGTPLLNAMPYFLQNSGEGRTPIMLAPRVEIRSVFPSLPMAMVFIIVVTLDVWYTLRAHPAISFIGFERNTHAVLHDNPVLQAIQSKGSLSDTHENQLWATKSK
ncbi:hypothetical protein ACHAPT_006183 [Fusarium lateritium]